MNVFFTDICFNKNSHFIDTLKELVSFDLVLWKNENKMIEPVLIDIDEIEQYEKFKKNTLVFICFSGSIDKEKVLYSKKYFKDFILGFIDCSEKAEKYKSTFDKILPPASQLSLNETISMKDLESLYKESLNELERVKKIHKKVVPVRKEHFKNISLYSKFMPGLRSGGELFDLVQCGNSIVIALGSFQSYLGTSVLLKNLEKLSVKNDLSKQCIEDFLEDFVNDCREVDIIDKDDYSVLQFDLLCFDMSTLTLSIYHFGDGMFLINDKELIESNSYILNENNFSQARYSLKVKRKDRLTYISPGAVKGFLDKKMDIREVFSSTINVMPEESLHEAMFQLKKNDNNSFLKTDASILIFEVNNHALIKI